MHILNTISLCIGNINITVNLWQLSGYSLLNSFQLQELRRITLGQVKNKANNTMLMPKNLDKCLIDNSLVEVNTQREIHVLSFTNYSSNSVNTPSWVPASPLAFHKPQLPWWETSCLLPKCETLVPGIHKANHMLIHILALGWFNSNSLVFRQSSADSESCTNSFSRERKTSETSSKTSTPAETSSETSTLAELVAGFSVTFSSGSSCVNRALAS